MSRVKHFKVVSSLPATLEPDSIYYVRVGTGFDLYTTTSSAPVIARPLNTSSSSGDVGRKGTKSIIRNGTNISTGSFYDLYETNKNDGIYSGSGSGWSGSGSNPTIIPYNCKIVKAHIRFSRARFDGRSSAGNLFLDIGCIDHNYNNTFNERILRFEIPSSFSGNDTGTGSYKYTITESDISAMSGSNNFNEGEMIGFLLRGSTSTPGRIYQIDNPFHSLTFEGI